MRGLLIGKPIAHVGNVVPNAIARGGVHSLQLAKRSLRLRSWPWLRSPTRSAGLRTQHSLGSASRHWGETSEEGRDSQQTSDRAPREVSE